MSPKSIEEYTVIFVKRYKKANYNQKKIILNEYCQVTGFHRKHAIRKLNNFRLFIKKKLKKRGRASKYNKKSIIALIKKIWLTANLPCSKILKSLLLPDPVTERTPLVLGINVPIYIAYNKLHQVSIVERFCALWYFNRKTHN